MIAVGARPIFETEVVKLDPGGFAELGTEWQSLEDRARGVSPYTSFAWLDAWLRAYSPPDPAVLRVRARDGDTIALGLVERRSGRRWAFGGEPVTSERGLLCAADLEADAWQAVRTWLRAERRRWATLDCGAAPSAALVLPNARTSEISLLRMPLPDSFEHYLAARTAKRRWALKRKLKALEDAGGTVRRAESAAVGLANFVRLHAERARAKGERHPQVDERLAQMLESLATAPSPELVVDEVQTAGETVGVSLHLAYGRCMYSYNIGVDTSAPGISPGLVLELAAIRDAIERGFEGFDFGTGYYKYKEELGGAPVERFSIMATSPSVRGVAVGLSRAAVRHGRRLIGRRHIARLRSLARDA